MFIGSVELKRRILEEGLVKDYINLDDQLQPASFDLTLKKVEKAVNEGYVFVNGKELPTMKEVQPIKFAGKDCYKLKPGSYIGYINEEVNIPKDLCAMHIQRSTLARCECYSKGWWDPGYNGRGTCYLDVRNEHGILIEKNAKVVQMTFALVTDAHLYKGQYQKENIGMESIKGCFS
jgi:dUTP pyrophosphatase